ncbi:hypothetical protein [Streptomyces sp. B93]|uniref:hypothetical protein n=1 Tax=Streptomyces sp. B93 TaxID=2824875 RepID=UPI001B372CD6|nr:hypothetical protein [Streptomyces sp. B93]MBQ1091390.1 hypothetical protein [Streptomyces sp. B93]
MPSGVLAFVTHSDCQGGRLIDPGIVVTRAAWGTGLAPLDRVALLQVPILNSTLAPSPDLPCSSAPWHTRVHADLLLFTRRQRPAEPRVVDRR